MQQQVWILGALLLYALLWSAIHAIGGYTTAFQVSTLHVRVPLNPMHQASPSTCSQVHFGALLVVLFAAAFKVQYCVPVCECASVCVCRQWVSGWPEK